MRLSQVLILLVAAQCLGAQTVEDPAVVRARVEVERVRALVASGVANPAQLQKAQDALADARDGAILRQDIYQQDLTEAQADELVGAAGRQFDRRKAAFDEAKQMVETGVAPLISLDTYLRDLDFARKECDLAETRARLAREVARQAEAEEAVLARGPAAGSPLTERFDGAGAFTPAMFRKTETAFEARFGKSLPVSAMGQTAVHRALGFDHRGRVDVALNPDQPEGVWLRRYLTENGIPFFAFRHAVPGKATGAHIHLGPMSTRLGVGD